MPRAVRLQHLTPLSQGALQRILLVKRCTRPGAAPDQGALIAGATLPGSQTLLSSQTTGHQPVAR